MEGVEKKKAVKEEAEEVGSKEEEGSEEERRRRGINQRRIKQRREGREAGTQSGIRIVREDEKYEEKGGS